MSKGFANNISAAMPYEKRNNSREFRDEDNKINERNIPKNINPVNDAKQEYDLKEKDIEDIEKLTNSKIMFNIGYGGFSTVKLIFNNQQKSYFAMKVVNLKNKKFKKKTPSKNREFIYQEILVNFNTRNHNIIKLYGYFNHKEYVLLILEYMNNRDLKYFMKKFHTKYPDGNFSEVLAAYFINQVLKALGYLKIRNILHRDIKPENIMLNSNYVSKLGDFSLSRKIDMNNNFKTSRSGTLPYLSPECVKKKVDIKPYHCEKLDLFSLGVVMYFLLFNKHPYNYKNQMNVKDYAKKLEESVLTFEGNNITKQCKNFLSGLLEKNITKRFSYEQAVNHPWILLIKEKVEEITANYHSDPEKMIHELNKCIVKDEYFERKTNYVGLNNYTAVPLNFSDYKKSQVANNTENNANPNYSNINSNMDTLFENALNMIKGNSSKLIESNVKCSNKIINENNNNNYLNGNSKNNNKMSICSCNNFDKSNINPFSLDKNNNNNINSFAILNNPSFNNNFANTKTNKNLNDNNNKNYNNSNSSNLNMNMNLNSDLPTGIRKDYKIDLATKEKNMNSIPFNNSLNITENNNNLNNNTMLNNTTNHFNFASAALINTNSNNNVLNNNNLAINNQAVLSESSANNNNNIFLQNLYVGKTPKIANTGINSSSLNNQNINSTITTSSNTYNNSISSNTNNNNNGQNNSLSFNNNNNNFSHQIVNQPQNICFSQEANNNNNHNNYNAPDKILNYGFSNNHINVNNNPANNALNNTNNNFSYGKPSLYNLGSVNNNLNIINNNLITMLDSTNFGNYNYNVIQNNSITNLNSLSTSYNTATAKGQILQGSASANNTAKYWSGNNFNFSSLLNNANNNINHNLINKGLNTNVNFTGASEKNNSLFNNDSNNNSNNINSNSKPSSINKIINLTYLKGIGAGSDDVNDLVGKKRVRENEAINDDIYNNYSVENYNQVNNNNNDFNC